MFFAITALGVSAVQIVVGIAIGMSLRKARQRQCVADDSPSTFRGRLQIDRQQPSQGLPGRQSDAPPRHEIEARAKDLLAPAKNSEAGGTTRNDIQPALAVDQLDKHGPAPLPGSPAIAESEVFPPGGNRRTATRRSFEFRQHVAPYHGGMLPGKASFREVECVDISATGFSFLSSQLPDFDSVVVALGVPPRQVHIWAQIVNRFQIDDGAAPLYRIGCRFVGQVNQ